MPRQRLDGNRDIGLFRVKLAPPHMTSQPAWSTNGEGFHYEWTYPEGITVRFGATPQAELVELIYTVVSHTTALLPQVHLHTCVTTTEASAFFPQLTTGCESRLPPDTRDQDYTELLTRPFVWSGGRPLRLDHTEHARRQVHLSLLPKGGYPLEWACWINSTNTFAEPLIHWLPFFGRIERGASATVRGALFLMAGSPEMLRVRAQQRAEPRQRPPSADGQHQQDCK